MAQGCGSRSGFKISLEPDQVSAQKSDLSEENLKIMSKVRQKIKRQQFPIKTHHKIDEKFSRKRCPDPDSEPDLS